MPDWLVMTTGARSSAFADSQQVEDAGAPDEVLPPRDEVALLVDDPVAVEKQAAASAPAASGAHDANAKRLRSKTSAPAARSARARLRLSGVPMSR